MIHINFKVLIMMKTEKKKEKTETSIYYISNQFGVQDLF